MTCTCCHRVASTSLGSCVIIEGKGPVCEYCLPLWGKIMSITDLSAIETEAIRKAGVHISPQLLEVILTVLWREGTRDLSAVTPEALAKLHAAVAADPAFLAAIGDLFVEYTRRVRLLLALQK